MEENQHSLAQNKWTWIFLCAVILLSFFTYFLNYWKPQQSFWDEGYHIASAQKYLNGVYFMEQHPPLGKLLIAAGEKLFYPKGQKNGYDSKYIGTDEGKNFPSDFSFAGYRFFPALLAWLGAVLIYLIFLLVAKNPFFAVGLSCLYIFDNALVVHLRAAMLEGPLLFFELLTILMFFLLFNYGKKCHQMIFILLCLIFGASFGLVATTKVLGLVLILLLPAYLIKLWPDWKKMILAAGIFIVGFLAVYIPVWQTHFSLGKRIQNSLPNAGYYQASVKYKQILSAGTSSNFLNFPVMMKDSLNFVGHYNNGVPKLDLSSQFENGSPPFMWPLGARAIRYRWDRIGSSYAYLYLQSNPVIWLSALLMILIGFSLLIASLFFHVRLKNKFLLALFLGIWASFMAAASMITRVLYLYSYFTALIVSFVIVALVFMELEHFLKWKITEKSKKIILLVFAILAFLSFVFFSPLTYGRFLTDQEFDMRRILPIWGLNCADCKPLNLLGEPFKAN